ncbi:MAG: MaoC family dehydratase [Rhodocyclaceae bacterium]|nr:MaoC family dehydratase [Rhodocyclaceae bacterium]
MTIATAAKTPCYLEDLSIGQRFVSAEHALDDEQIIAFARQFDPQPFHLDHAAAANSLFGGLVASGWHVASLTMRLIVGDRAPFAGGVIGAGVELSWPRPTRPGDVLRVDTSVIDIAPSRSKPDRGIVTVRSETSNQADEVVQIMTSRLVVPSRIAKIASQSQAPRAADSKGC